MQHFEYIWWVWISSFMLEVAELALHCVCDAFELKALKWFLLIRLTFDPAWCLKYVFGFMGIFPKCCKSIMLTGCSTVTKPDTQIGSDKHLIITIVMCFGV